MGMVTGEIEAKSNKFDKYSILVNGNWYSSKYEIKADKGDVVEFDDGDRKYARRVKVISKGGGGPVASSAGISRTPGFPVPVDTKDRSIVRQSSLKSAVEMVTTLRGVIDTPKDWGDLEDQMELWAGMVVSVARIFEDYTAGDGDYQEAVAELKG